MDKCPSGRCQQTLLDGIDGLKTRWKLFGAIVGTVITIIAVALTLSVNSFVRAQDKQEKAREKIETVAQQNTEKCQDLEVAVEGMKKDVEWIKQSLEKQEKNDELILESLRKLNGDGR